MPPDNANDPDNQEPPNDCVFMQGVPSMYLGTAAENNLKTGIASQRHRGKKKRNEAHKVPGGKDRESAL